jgi:citrate lyase subunit beta / citryl-CoA lyase
MVRSWLFAPGHSERMLARVFDSGADEPLLDLEDGVGPDLKDRARAQVAEVLRGRAAWVRVNRPRTPECEADLAALGGLVKGLRLPKVEAASDLAWVRERMAGREVPITATIESAAGATAVEAICAAPGVTNLTFGNVDFSTDTGTDPDAAEATLYVRSRMVLASRASGIEAPSDGVYTHYQDDEGLLADARRARRLGFFGKSCIHPRQVPVVNAAFTPTPDELRWARSVVDAYARSGGAATRLEGGEMVDVPVYERARRLLLLGGIGG